MASIKASLSGEDDSSNKGMDANAIEKDELRWPSPPAKRPVPQLPATPPRAEPAKAPSTYFDALRGKGTPEEVTKSPSDGTEVRWFYSKRALLEDQSAALVPSTEAALKGEWLRFGTLDSAALEAAYKQQEEKLLSCWWREFAEVSVGPQLRDRERIERGVGSSVQGSPQASPQKVPSKSTRASPAAGTRLKDEASSTSKGSPSKTRLLPPEQSTPQSVSKPVPDAKESLQKDKDEAEQYQQSFLSKVSLYLPSLKGSSAAGPQSPSKQQAGEKASEKTTGIETGPPNSVQAAAAAGGGGEVFESVLSKGDATSKQTRDESDGEVKESTGVALEAALGETSPEVPSSADAAPLADVSAAAQVDPGREAQGNNESGEKEPAKATTTSEADDSSEVGIQVKGGLYEAFLESRKLAPIFWKAANCRILRGSWFAQPRKTRDWLPLREDIAEQLEIAYWGQVWRRRSFLPNGMYAHKVNLAGPSLGLYGLFMGEDDTWEAWLGVDGSGVISRMFSSGHPTTRLRRGFKDEALPQGQEEMRQRREEEEDDRKAQVGETYFAAAKLAQLRPNDTRLRQGKARAFLKEKGMGASEEDSKNWC